MPVSPAKTNAPARPLRSSQLDRSSPPRRGRQSSLQLMAKSVASSPAR